jgi:hypothetical protein
MAVNYNKALRAKYEIEGVSDYISKLLIGPVLLEIYNLACTIVNNGGVEQFNSEYKKSHSKEEMHEDNDEYIEAFEHYFKGIADKISDKYRTKDGVTYKLREHEPILINFDKGYFTVYGYVENLKN